MKKDKPPYFCEVWWFFYRKFIEIRRGMKYNNYVCFLAKA